MAIEKKLLEFQKLGITLKKDGTNPAFGRGSKYVTLNEVLDKVKGPLNDLGVVIVQEPVGDRFDMYGNEPIRHPISGLKTRLIDTEYVGKEGYSSLSEVTSFVPFVNTPDMQKLGGAITYARRYSLIALLGLEDEDDDGNTASNTKAAPKGVQDATGDPLKDDFNL